MAELTAEMIQRGRGADPNEVARRRKALSNVRAAREKLVSSVGLERSFEYELLKAYAAQQYSAAAAMIVLAVAIGAVATAWVAVEPVLTWLCFVLSFTGVNALMSRRFLAMPEETVEIRPWRRRFVLAETLRGASWALIVLVMLTAGGASAKVFVLFTLLMVAAVTSMLSAAIKTAVYAVLAALALAMFGFLDPRASLDSAAMTGMGLSALAYFAFITHRLHATMLADVESRAEKDQLVAELEEAKANSDEARRKAEEANLAKSRFLATMSHELRTPLNAILGFSEVLKTEMFGPHTAPSYKEYAADIHGSGEHLLNLINEILDLSRIEAGRYDLQEEAVSIAHVVEECRHMLMLRAKGKGQSIKEMIEPSLPRLWADERAVRQIVLNILSNAIKFTPQGGEIVIKAGWTASGGQYVSVRDNGPGIPEDELNTVLSSFGRGSLAIKTAEQGSGLGLPIVKGLIDLHGGGFHLKSKPREGTEVIVTFPSSRVMDALAAVRSDRETPADPAAPRSTLRQRLNSAA